MLKLDIFNKEVQSSESRFDSVNIFTSGEQVNFDSRPTVNNTGILLSGEGGGFPSQFIFGEISEPISILQQNNSPFQTIDIISDGVQLTRGTYGVLYNPNDQSEGASNPTNTEWNTDGWGDLSDLAARTYVDLDQIAGGGNFGNAVIGNELIMHDTSTDKYYKFLFSHWQSGAGGNPNYRGFSYTRTELGYKQQVDQLVDFTTRPVVNGTGVLLNGDFNIVAPKTGDFILKQSYANWLYGKDLAIDNSLSKWDAAQSSNYNLEFALQFLGGTINNQIIPKSNFLIGIGTTVNASTIYFRDDGYGLQPANYVDFINNIFISYGLGSRIYAQNASERFVLNYATSEQFQFLFKEVGNGYLINPQYYQIGAVHPYRIYDQITENDFVYGLINPDVKYWTNL